jgi:hypothetical protein
VIDRKALISRHKPRYEKALTNAPLSLGNGQFCFTADFTGLQSFPDRYSPCPLCTMAEWGWHSYPHAPSNAGELRLTAFDAQGRQVGYPVDETGQEALFKGLRQNPHRCNLASLGFTGAAYEDFAPLGQTLDLWEGLLVSRFTFRGRPVTVETLVRPDQDTIALRIKPAPAASGTGEGLGLRLAFPYGSHRKNGGDHSLPERHRTSAGEAGLAALRVSRCMDNLEYEASISLGPGVRFYFDGAHAIMFHASGETLELSVRFSPEKGAAFPGGFAKARELTSVFWERYWLDGGAIDLSAATDPRAFELERRIVLSQYLTAIQSRGSLPPAETGLTCNSWYGKFHLEMHYWHSAHFALWNRTAELERSLAWYRQILPVARGIAASQGYVGARWPKMCGPEGRNSPSSIAVLLVWQQPHPILLAELCYRAKPCRALLETYREVVEASAEFMESFARQGGGAYGLGPPLIPAQECFDPRTVVNPGYEVEYFRWALRLANQWRKRLGEPERADFAQAAAKLARPAVYAGVFPAHENCPKTFSQYPFFTDHPSMLAMLGVLPGQGIDHGLMNVTLDRVLAVWDRESLWGWDFPMMAMCAARLGRRKDAVELLLMESPKNTWLPNGHNAQGDREDLPLYLPGNGGLLLAMAMLTAGWDGDAGIPVPGLPDDGSFRVRAENLRKYI